MTSKQVRTAEAAVISVTLFVGVLAFGLWYTRRCRCKVRGGCPVCDRERRAGDGHDGQEPSPTPPRAGLPSYEDATKPTTDDVVLAATPINPPPAALLPPNRLT